jgi:hypothetical protein
MQVLKDDFRTLNWLFESCDMDYNALKSQKIDEDFFSDYFNQRIVNSFLFNYIKIQDKMGSKLFRNLLFELKEIDDYSIPMVDILNILERLNILNSRDEWDRLREIRNIITHEYPSDIDERIENIQLALEGYEILSGIFYHIKSYCSFRGIIKK